MKSSVYCTSFCNRGHRLSDGKPVSHECAILPVQALTLERDGDVEKAIAILYAARPLRRHPGV